MYPKVYGAFPEVSSVKNSNLPKSLVTPDQSPTFKVFVILTVGAVAPKLALETSSSVLGLVVPIPTLPEPFKVITSTVAFSTPP